MLLWQLEEECFIMKTKLWICGHCSYSVHLLKSGLIGALVTVLLLLHPADTSGASQTASPQPVRANNSGAQAQAQLEHLATRQIQHSPTNRPLVLSERASTKREWAEKALARGYATSGHTNAQWDAKVRAAFSGYANYSRASQWDQYKPMVEATSAA